MGKLFSAQVREHGIFLDERFLYPDFIPEKLPFRDKALKSLAYCFEPLLAGRKPLNVFLAGPTGVGKTACAKYVLRELQEESGSVKSLYLNCFEYNSRVSVLSAIANFLGSAVPRRGLATDEIFNDMLESLRKCGFTPVVVLDEVDQILLSEANAKLLYDLLRVMEYEKRHIGLVLISNDVSLVSRLDSRIRSSLTEEAVIFESYSPEQLKAILSERAVLAFAKGALPAEVIGVAAAHAARLGGDARVALESLLKAGRIAERSNSKAVGTVHLRQAFDDVDAVSMLKSLKYLEKDELRLLKIIAERQPMTSGSIYDSYSGSDSGALKERRLRTILSTLEKRGLVAGKSVTLGNRGKTKEYSSLVPGNFLLKEIESLLQKA
ncbi:MAG: AAA family ATPase [Candidatus Diapherotrites archaeon]|uniref:ORC1-type DNA replication protein n=1 Tax=Candidatus Iainarchaeum sp. TaxID=3101447 RepID=A0A8T3YKU3_9ARCH|nr:AAA family ATPase [Candidatus Diapherotrites archaeon]